MWIADPPTDPYVTWVYYTTPFGFTLFWHFWTSLFDFLNYCVWLKITEEVSGPEIRIWSILLIQSGLKWFKQVDVSFHIKTTWWVSLLVDQGHEAKFYGRLRLIRSVWEHQKFSCSNLIKLWFCGGITPSLLALPCFGSFWASLFNFLNYCIWRRITDKGPVPYCPCY